MGEAAPKEGSMEEILASIRRIISSETNSRKPDTKIEPYAEKGQASHNSGSPVSAVPNRSAAFSDTIAARNNTAVSQSPMQPLVQSPATSSPGSLADLASRVRAGEISYQTSAPANAPSVAPFAPDIAKQASASSLSAMVSGMRSAEGTAASRSNPSPPPAEKNDSFKELVSKLQSAAVGDKKDNTEAARVELSAAKMADTMRAFKAEAKASATEEVSVPDPISVSAMPAIRKEISVHPEADEINLAQKAEARVEVPVFEQKNLEEKDVDKKSSETEAFREALVAPSTQMAVSGSLDRLRQTVEGINSAQVEAMLRPMLKDWLDSNLPAMVERMVQEEINKITRK